MKSIMFELDTNLLPTKQRRVVNINKIQKYMKLQVILTYQTKLLHSMARYHNSFIRTIFPLLLLFIFVIFFICKKLKVNYNGIIISKLL